MLKSKVYCTVEFQPKKAMKLKPVEIKEENY